MKTFFRVFENWNYLVKGYFISDMIYCLQDCFPARFSAVHFVNQPWYIEAVFKMLKPFLKEKNRNKVCDFRPS